MGDKLLNGNYSVLQSPYWPEGMLHKPRGFILNVWLSESFFKRPLISLLILNLADRDSDWTFLKQAPKIQDLKSWYSSRRPRSGDIIQLTGFSYFIGMNNRINRRMKWMQRSIFFFFFNNFYFPGIVALPPLWKRTIFSNKWMDCNQPQNRW